jgi:hypothetical protein
MSEYYPIEFLPENSTTNQNLKNENIEPVNSGEPHTRNYLRNNLPYEDSNNDSYSNIVDYGKTYTITSTPINKGDPSYSLTQPSNISSTPNNSNSSQKTIKTKERKTRINIDSRLRNIEPVNILDTLLSNLTNCLYFTTNSNIITIHHPNHNFSLEDKIILEYATGTNIKIKKSLQFEKNSIYARINQPNHGMLNNGTIYNINISNVEGNITSGTYLLNYPINLINKNHQVYFTRTNSDIFNPDYYYINLGIPAEIEYTYLYSMNITYLHIRGIPINEINANYPITSDRISGYHVIENIISPDYYQISVSSSSDSTNDLTSTGDGGNILIVKILNMIDGYPDNNNYIVNLQRNFYHVKQVNLLDTIFPITEKIVKASPISKQNNLFYWQNLNDGNVIYSVGLLSGNYSLDELQIELKKQIELTIRPNIDSTQLINNIYTYNTNRVNININQTKNTFEIQFYQELILNEAIFRSTLTYNDGFTRIILNYKNHNLLVGDEIILSNVIGTEKIPANYLNGLFTIETVINADSVEIKLDRFNDNTDTNTYGGTAIHLLQPIKSRLLFNYPNTLGTILGFYNVGNTNSITPYDYMLTNYNLYEVDVQKNSIGIVTQPRIDTRILNLNPNNYILILVDLPFNDQLNLFDTGTNLFAKILLTGSNESYVYDQFIQCGSTFQEPIATLSNITFSFYGPDNLLYDFNNVEHSFTIEIVEQLDELDII